MASIHTYIHVATGTTIVVLSIILGVTMKERERDAGVVLRSSERADSLQAVADTLAQEIAFEKGLREGAEEDIKRLEALEAEHEKNRNAIRNPRRPRITGADSLRTAILRSTREQ